MSYRIGFIGVGKMATAIIKGITSKGMFTKEEIIGCARSQASIDRAKKDLGIHMTTSVGEVCDACNLIILAVKPQQINDVLTADIVKKLSGSVIISVLAGVKINTLNGYVPDAKIIRVMPNLCCSVFEGVSCYCIDNNITNKEEEMVREIFGSVGLATKVEEKDMDGVTGLSGSSPAFVFMVIDALAEAGVREGLPKDVSLKLATQTVLGSAKTVLGSTKSPDQLKVDVCSPGGTTIEGVKVLDEAKMKDSIIKAVHASAEKSRLMSKR